MVVERVVVHSLSFLLGVVFVEILIPLVILQGISLRGVRVPGPMVGSEDQGSVFSGHQRKLYTTFTISPLESTSHILLLASSTDNPSLTMARTSKSAIPIAACEIKRNREQFGFSHTDIHFQQPLTNLNCMYIPNLLKMLTTLM